MGVTSTTSLNPVAVSGGDAYLVRDIGAAWQAAHAYIVGDVVTNGGHAYRCIVAGTSAGSGGPTGTTFGTSIGDGAGALAWTYIGDKLVIALSALTDANGTIIGAVVGSPLYVALVGVDGATIASRTNVLPTDRMPTSYGSNWTGVSIRTGGDYGISADTQVKASAGKVRDISITQTSGSTLYVGVFAKSGVLATNDYPIGRMVTCGSGTPANLDFGEDGLDVPNSIRIGFSSTPQQYTAVTPATDKINTFVRFK